MKYIDRDVKATVITNFEEYKDKDIGDEDFFIHFYKF